MRRLSGWEHGRSLDGTLCCKRMEGGTEGRRVAWRRNEDLEALVMEKEKEGWREGGREGGKEGRN